MTVSIDTMRARLCFYVQKRVHFERLLQTNGGSLPRRDWWRYEYVSDPYLLGCPDDRLALRFHDVFVNLTELSDAALIGVLPIDEGNQFMRKFTHLLEEYALRGGVPPLNAIPRPMPDYFAGDGPIAMGIFANYARPARPFVIKYGNRQFLEPMHGRER